MRNTLRECGTDHPNPTAISCDAQDVNAGVYKRCPNDEGTSEIANAAQRSTPAASGA